MKAKVLVLIALTALVTLSFTYSSVKDKSGKSKVTVTSSADTNAPAGGFGIEEK